MKKKITLLHQDEDILLINKPANYLSIPDRYKPDLPNVKAYLQHQFENVYTVHRIDKETSGVMVFARNETAHKQLSEQFYDRTVDKKYWVLVRGHPQPAEGEIDQPIGPHSGKPGKMMIHRKGKASLTYYRTLETFRQFSLLEATIKTGRTHQIRVHLQAIGHPLAVDPLYGGQEAFYLSAIKGHKYRQGKYQEEERPLLSRVSLHAYSIAFAHPVSGEIVTYKAELPKDLRATMAQLKKYG